MSASPCAYIQVLTTPAFNIHPENTLAEMYETTPLPLVQMDRVMYGLSDNCIHCAIRV